MKIIFQLSRYIFTYFQITRQMKKSHLLSREVTAAFSGKWNTTRISIISAGFNSLAFLRLQDISEIFSEFCSISSLSDPEFGGHAWPNLCPCLSPCPNLIPSPCPRFPSVFPELLADNLTVFKNKNVQNYPGLSRLPFKFQIFHNSSPSI